MNTMIIVLGIADIVMILSMLGWISVIIVKHVREINKENRRVRGRFKRRVDGTVQNV